MKIKRFLLGGLLSLAMSLGIGVTLISTNTYQKEAATVEAATSSVTLAGSFNSWNTTADPLTLSGDYWVIEKTLAVNDTFKVVVNGSDWVGDGDGVTWCSGMGSEGKGNNFKVLTAGTYRIKAEKTIGDYGDKSYGIVFKNVYTVTKYKVLDGGSAVSIGSEKVEGGSTYAVPANRYEAGYTFNGWFTTSTGSTKYTATAINANTSIYAKYTSGTWSGTIYVDLNNSGWANAAANYAICFMDKTTYPSEISAWSSYVTGTAAGVRLVTLSYDLPFNPTMLIVVRYNASYSQSSWNSNKWNSVWSQSVDTNIDSIPSTIRISDVKDDTYKHEIIYYGYPKVVRWSPTAADIYLDHAKLNGSNNVEFYSTNVVLAANQQFKVQVSPYFDGDYYSTYTTHDSLTSTFTGGGGSNITCKTAGTYAFYFDSYAHTLYITKVELAEADEWSQYFLNNVNCDATGVSEPTGWSTCATAYAALSGAAKNIIYPATANPSGSYVEKAVARYDAALRSHPSLDRFIVNSSSQVRPLPSGSRVLPVISGISNNTNIIVIAGVSSIIVAAGVGGFFLLRKRKEN